MYDHQDKLVDRIKERHNARESEYSIADLKAIMKWAALELQRRDPAVATEEVKNLNRMLGVLPPDQPRRDPNLAIYKFDSVGGT